jgi:hypothetical protein
MRGLTAAGAAALARELLAAGESLPDIWRHCVLQLLDDYAGDASRLGVTPARRRFAEPPAPTGSTKVDAALASLAEHLSRRDGWPTPGWAQDPARYTAEWWFVTRLPGMHATALQESPTSFRKRGVFITEGALSRA